MNQDFGHLRGKIDSNDPFMTQGHQILKVRSIDKKIPSWVDNPAKIQKILLRSFPKLKTNSNQRIRAARWARLIQLYWKLGYTRGQIVSEFNNQTDGVDVNPVTLACVDSSIRNILRAAAGLQANGRGPVGKPKGGNRKSKVPVSKNL